MKALCRVSFICFCLFFLPAQAFAIVNAEDTTLLTNEEGWAGKASLSIAGDRGNVTQPMVLKWEPCCA